MNILLKIEISIYIIVKYIYQFQNKNIQIKQREAIE